MTAEEFENDDFMEEVIVEKEKRKRQPDPSYNQDVALGIICLTLGLLIIFRVDVLLIHAVAIRGYYPHAGILSLGLFGITLLTILWWAIGQYDGGWGLDTVFIAILLLGIGCVGAFIISLYVDSLGLKTVEAVSPWLFLPAFGIALFGWWWTRKRTVIVAPLGIKIIAFLVMGFAAFYCVGLWSLTRPPGGLIDDLVVDNRRYYVYFEWQAVDADSGIPIDPRLSLHECNQYGLFCKELWAVNYDRHNPDMTLFFDANTNSLTLISNNEILYTHTP